MCQLDLAARNPPTPAIIIVFYLGRVVTSLFDLLNVLTRQLFVYAMFPYNVCILMKFIMQIKTEFWRNVAKYVCKCFMCNLFITTESDIIIIS